MNLRPSLLIMTTMDSMTFIFCVTEGDILYRNTGKGTFEDVTDQTDMVGKNRRKHGLVF